MGAKVSWRLTFKMSHAALAALALAIG